MSGVRLGLICLLSLVLLRVPMARGQDSDLNLERWEGTLMMMTGEMAGEEGDDHTSTDIIYLLQVTEPAFSLFELHIPHALLHSPLGSGDPVMVTGYRQGEDAIVAVSIASRMAAFGGSSTEGVAGRHRLMMEQDLESVLFAGPNNRGPTLEAYYAECSRGKQHRGHMGMGGRGGAGPLHRWLCTNLAGVRQYAASALGVDLTRYRHRVLVMPRGFMYEAGCGWTGLGTLGPVDKGPDGLQYVSSMVWIQGESSSSVMAYMHELGHNLYLHHANDSKGCEYCDYSSLMGGCCALRCFNAPNNWQLGWGQPLAVLNSATWPQHSWLYFDLPAQHTTDAHIIWIQPDWTPDGRREVSTGVANGVATTGPASFPVSYYISYRIDSGRYDTDMPDMYLYATSIYFFDGATQTSVRRTRHVQAVFTGETFSNATEGWMLKQLSHGVLGSRVGLCRFSEVTEKSCGDGQPSQGSAKSPPPATATGGGRKRPPPPAPISTGGEIAPTKKGKKSPPPAGGAVNPRKAKPPPPSGKKSDSNGDADY
eukprot:XP_001690315.1 predicted protein [Chlamydomonas reinhardtii]